MAGIFYITANIYNRKQETVEICSRLTIKTTRLTLLKWFWYTPFSSVSLIDFGHVFVYWESIILINKSAYFCLLNEAYLKKLCGESLSWLNTLFKIFNTVISLFGNVISRCQKEKFLTLLLSRQYWRHHSFSTYATFSEKLFLPPDTNTYKCVSGGKKC